MYVYVYEYEYVFAYEYVHAEAAVVGHGATHLHEEVVLEVLQTLHRAEYTALPGLRVCNTHSTASDDVSEITQAYNDVNQKRERMT